MITGSRSVLSIAMEPCWSPPSIHPAPTSARFPFRNTELLKSALLSFWGLWWVVKGTHMFALSNLVMLLWKFTFEREEVWGGRC